MNAGYKDYYRVLGVERGATEDEIRSAFRKLAREYHPDVARNKAVAEEKFKEINEAYEVLGDADKRRKYDALGADGGNAQNFTPPPGWNQRGANGDSMHEFRFGGTGYSDFFEQFFGGQRAGFTRRGRDPFDFETDTEQEQPQRGGDVEGALMVTLDEALHGSVRSISLERVNPQSGTTETHTFRVRIPAGVCEGQLIRVAGKGDPGWNGAEAGDLLLRVRLARHPDFTVHGADLYHELELQPWQAVLGATVEVLTLEGRVSVRVPPGTEQGGKLRVRGRGLPEANGKRGDLLVTISILIPKQVSREEKALWEQLARLAK
ncbi:MAG: J domain-containing protein [Verrucomicrobiota bacterium]